MKWTLKWRGSRPVGTGREIAAFHICGFGLTFHLWEVGGAKGYKPPIVEVHKCWGEPSKVVEEFSGDEWKIRGIEIGIPRIMNRFTDFEGWTNLIIRWR